MGRCLKLETRYNRKSEVKLFVINKREAGTNAVRQRLSMRKPSRKWQVRFGQSGDCNWVC
jgi:hypothetical protein